MGNTAPFYSLFRREHKILMSDFSMPGLLLLLCNSVVCSVQCKCNRARAHIELPVCLCRLVVQLEFSWLPKVPNRLIFKFILRKVPAMMRVSRRKRKQDWKYSINTEDYGPSFPCLPKIKTNQTSSFACRCTTHGWFFSSSNSIHSGCERTPIRL